MFKSMLKWVILPLVFAWELVRGEQEWSAGQQHRRPLLDIASGEKPKTFQVVRADGTSVVVTGGPYRNKPEGAYGVCCAEEFMHLPYDAGIAIQDFSVPSSVEEVRKLLLKVAEAMLDAPAGQVFYFGCMGGKGRTGTVMALLVRYITFLSGKSEQEYMHPIAFVRDQYNPHAVETTAQAAYVENFDVKAVNNT